MKYGFFSPRSKSCGNPTYWYRTPAGEEVEVSLVYNDPETDDFKWEDKVCVGEVTDFIRLGQVKEEKWGPKIYRS